MDDKRWDDFKYALGTFLFWLIICTPPVAFFSYTSGKNVSFDGENEFARGAYATCYMIELYQNENPNTLEISIGCNQFASDLLDSGAYSDTPGYEAH